MSTQYQSGKDVPTEVLAARLNELAHVVARKRDRIGDEFTMRIPAECDRDADLVMSEAAIRLSAAPNVAGLVAGAEFLIHRLREMEDLLVDDELCRNYLGHVAPAITRFEGLVAAHREQGGEA